MIQSTFYSHAAILLTMFLCLRTCFIVMGLSLAGNEITFAGASALADLLEHTFTLTTLT